VAARRLTNPVSKQFADNAREIAYLLCHGGKKQKLGYTIEEMCGWVLEKLCKENGFPMN